MAEKNNRKLLQPKPQEDAHEESSTEDALTVGFTNNKESGTNWQTASRKKISPN